MNANRGWRFVAAPVICAVLVTVGVLLTRSSGSKHPAAIPLLAESEISLPAAGARRSAPPVTSPFVRNPGGDRAHAAGDPVFGQPTIVGVQGYGFEEDLRLDPTDSNRMYTSVPDSLSSNTSWIWKTKDAGKTWKWVPAAIDGTSLVTPGKPFSASGQCPGGGDTELGVDTAGHLYFNDLTLANFSGYRSDDQGSTFLCSSTAVPDTLVDRQWYAIDGDPVGGTAPAPSVNSLYLANDEIGPGDPFCPNSTANNVLVVYRSPVTGIPNSTAGLLFGPRQTGSAILTCDEGIMGNDEVSPVATTTNDANPNVPLATAVRHVFVVHDNAAFDQILMARCTPVDVLVDPSGLSCTDHIVSTFAADGIRHTGANFPTMAIDSAGTLYAVWEQAPTIVGGTPTANHVGNSALMYSYSTNEGNSWAMPTQIPTPGLNNDVFAWTAAGSTGRIDVMFLGTSALVNPNNAACPDGPDSINGVWSVYMVQSLSANTGTPNWTAPVLAGEHFMHKGSIQTVLGGQCSGSDRTLGDFFQLRVDAQGAAHMSFADSNNIDEVFLPHAMYVDQVGGNSVNAGTPTVSGGTPIQLNSTTDVLGDGKYEAVNGNVSVVSPNDPSLDIVQSQITKPAAATCNPANTPCYRVTMTVQNLSGAPLPPTGDTDTNVQWLTQWLVPTLPTCLPNTGACLNGGANFMVYAESTLGGAIHCFDGQNGATLNGGGITFTYIGSNAITAPGACTATPGASGTITIDVPIADVSLPQPFSSRLYSVTASTTSSDAPFDSVPSFSGIGGVLFNLIDSAPGFDAEFGSTAVTVRAFTAKRSGGAVTLRWRTGSEVGLAGFDVYRRDGSRNVRLNRSLIPASGGTAGHAYVWRTRLPAGRHAGFRLEAVHADGTRSWMGSIRS